MLSPAGIRRRRHPRSTVTAAVIAGARPTMQGFRVKAAPHGVIAGAAGGMGLVGRRRRLRRRHDQFHGDQRGCDHIAADPAPRSTVTSTVLGWPGRPRARHRARSLPTPAATIDNVVALIGERRSPPGSHRRRQRSPAKPNKRSSPPLPSSPYSRAIRAGQRVVAGGPG